MNITQPKTGTVKLERTFKAPVEKVWQALTDPKQMKQWYFETMKDFKPVVGFETQVDVPHAGDVFPHLWKVVRVVPNEVLAYEWRYEGHEGNSLLTFQLQPDGENTKLTLTHENLDSFRGDLYPKYKLDNFVNGWTGIIGNSLKEFLEGNAK